MTESLQDRMRRGERDFAEAMGDAIETIGIVTRVRRRRAARTVVVTAAAAVLVGSGASGAVAWWPQDPAVPSESAVPSATAGPAPVPSENPAPSLPPEQYGAEPEMVDGVPVLVAASQDIADATLRPRPGPDFVPGQRRPLDQVVSQGAVDSCLSEWCGLPVLPAFTSAVLDSGDLTATVLVWGVLNDGTAQSDRVDYIAVAGPDTGAYMAVDVSAWAADEGVGQVEVTDAAADPDAHVVAGVLSSSASDGQEDTGESIVVLWDLDTGASTVVAEGLDHASIEWDGAHWRLFGYGPQGTLGALVDSDGQSWTADGIDVARGWWLTEEQGFTRLENPNAWGQWWVLGGVAYPWRPDAVKYCQPPYAASATEGYVRMTCQSEEEESSIEPGALNNYQLTAGEGWAQLDAALESQAPTGSSSIGALDGGYVVSRGAAGTTYVKDGQEVALQAPSVEPIRVATRDGGLWTLGSDGVGWISPDLTYRLVIPFDAMVAGPSVYPYGERPSN